MTAELAAAQIKQRHSMREYTVALGPVIIAVDGFPGAGKSTFAAELATALGDTCVVGVDAFFIGAKGYDPSELWADPGELVRIDRARLERDVLTPLRSGQPAGYRPVDFLTKTPLAPIAIPPQSYLIMEGISVLHPSLARYIDYAIWMNTPKTTAQARGRARDIKQRGIHHHLWPLWTAAYERYRSRYHPEARADYVVDNNTRSARSRAS